MPIRLKYLKIPSRHCLILMFVNGLVKVRLTGRVYSLFCILVMITMDPKCSLGTLWRNIPVHPKASSTHIHNKRVCFLRWEETGENPWRTCTAPPHKPKLKIELGTLELSQFIYSRFTKFMGQLLDISYGFVYRLSI